MESRRRKLSAKENNGKKHSLSYDNKTFIPDPDILSRKESDIVLGNVDSVCEGREVGGIEDEDICERNRHGRKSRTSVPCKYVKEKGNEGDVGCTKAVKETSEKENTDVVHDENAEQLLGDSYGETNTQSPCDKRAILDSITTSTCTEKQSPTLDENSFPLDPNNQPSKPVESRQERKSCKIRSFSDTYNPMSHYYLNTKTNQFEKNRSADKRRKKYKYHRDLPPLSPIPGDDSAPNDFVDLCDGTTNNQEGSEDNTLMNEQKSRGANAQINKQQSMDHEKVKGNKRWLRKGAKHATFDEGAAHLTKTRKPTFDGPRNITDDGEVAEKSDDVDDDRCGQCNEERTPQRKISTGKLIKQSVSQGFSKFKQISLSGRNHSRKTEYAMITDDDAIVHETSKRIQALKSSQEKLNACAYIIHPTGGNVTGSERILRRSSSLPDCLDSGSEGSVEELSDLYLPRRMAICPDLPVEAMKQLRTYLVLTRFKQYCIV